MKIDTQTLFAPLMGLPPSKEKRDMVCLVVEIFMIQCMIQTWQVFGEALKEQAIESTKRHRRGEIRQQEHHHQEACATWRRLIEGVSRTETPLPTSSFLQSRLIASQPV